ncbi:DNA-directed RNA polymerase [Methanohalobium evestigatum Z-7303]|uniref:DNA-directed RNA polymerase subunit Rpo3 n=1 Tax=Methanohalobium evestigatum (strain ATCC BAA-1072 / DSM 3721 / NBRC 107634 / OCM 161 / Z-7303) TaxID=644295 RepID=D7E8Q4_METEZ|nr:DNA-directed RNA polymerase subunit D [Methanohalobium evestigatum]ADI73725.1 DNA-directed RNA polymerase [Methanohalobium evestigatum Z-7303]
MTMKVDMLELSERSARFVLSNTTPAFANSIRRAMLADVPTFAIDDLNIYNNTSVLYDEQLGLRLALIPLATENIDDYTTQDECTCEEGCPSCEVSITLSAEGPKMVYSGDLISSDPGIQPADTNIPIIELKEDQRVVLEALAHKGLGKDNAKWQAGVACGYKNLPLIRVNNCDKCGLCVSECPKGIIYLDEEGAKVADENLMDCILCKLCEEACEIDAISVKEDESSFLFTVESDGSYSSQQLIINAGNTIKAKATEMQEILNNL